jgi:hypothetical protein
MRYVRLSDWSVWLMMSEYNALSIQSLSFSHLFKTNLVLIYELGVLLWSCFTTIHANVTSSRKANVTDFPPFLLSLVQLGGRCA